MSLKKVKYKNKRLKKTKVIYALKNYSFNPDYTPNFYSQKAKNQKKFDNFKLG